MTDKKYKLLKDLPNLNAGAEFKWNELAKRYEYMDGIYQHFTKLIVENAKDWFEELVTEPSIVPERIEVLNVSFGTNLSGDDMPMAYYHKFGLNKTISHDKLPLIKQAIENVLNDTVVEDNVKNFGVFSAPTLIKMYSQSEVDAMMEDAFYRARDTKPKEPFYEGRPEEYPYKFENYQSYKATLPLQQVQEDKPDMKDNVIELLKEDLECVHLYLDDKLTPRKDSYGKDYSIVGRIKFLEKYCYNPMVIKSDNICPTTNKPCDDECCPVGAICNLNNGHEFSVPQPEAKDKPFVWTDKLVVDILNMHRSSDTILAKCVYDLETVKRWKDAYDKHKGEQSPTNLQESKEWDNKKPDLNSLTPQPSTTVKYKKEYEIIEYGYCQNNENKPDQQYISKVKRLSDNTVWVVGEIHGATSYRDRKIDSFEINPMGDLIINQSGGITKLESLTKLPTPNTDTISSKPVLFTTEDGVDIKEGDDYFFIDAGWDIRATAENYNWVGSIKAKSFSTKSAAELYILKNKPCLSFNEIMQSVSQRIGNYDQEQLKKEIQEKINK